VYVVDVRNASLILLLGHKPLPLDLDSDRGAGNSTLGSDYLRKVVPR
jgi:hypothetical protein